jgi:IS30 family transposase
VLRRTLPKGTNLSVHSQADLDAIALHRNAKSRKFPGWKSPAKLCLPPGSLDFQAFRATTINPTELQI